MDTAGEDEDSSSVQERYSECTAGSVGCRPVSPPTVIFEGRMGKLGRMQRLSSPNKAVAHHDSSQRSLILSPSAVITGSKNRADVDLAGLVQDAEVPHYAIIFDTDVLKELVKPFAESLHVKIQGSTKESLAEKNVIVTYIHYQTSVKCQDVGTDSVSSQSPARLEARTPSVRIAFSDADSERFSSNMDEGKPTCEKENKTVTGMINKLMQKSNNQPNGHDDPYGDCSTEVPIVCAWKKEDINRTLYNTLIGQLTSDRFAKAWEEPLLAAHDQAKLNFKMKKEAKIEAKLLAEEERRNCERQLSELRDLANCVHTATTPGVLLGRANKILRFLKNPFRVFRSQKIKYGGYPIAREAKVVNPNTRLFSGCRTIPSGPTDCVLASMQNASQKRISRSNIEFEKVDSTNRDVPAWTREESLRKNGRIPERSNDMEEEKFGGVLGNNYLNNYLDDGMAGGVVSDYDSDSD